MSISLHKVSKELNVGIKTILSICNQHNIECKNYFDIHKKEYEMLNKDILTDLESLLNKHTDSVFQQHQNIIDIIRLSNALAYINGVNINKWISVEMSK